MAAASAANKEDPVQESKDVTDCFICNKICYDPRLLPCIHTFCMQCLINTGERLKRKSGDEMPCPVCRKGFKIPLNGGYAELPKDIFIDRLAEMVKISKSPSTSVDCDECIRVVDPSGTEKATPAKSYCKECRDRLCEDCCKSHRKNRMSKDHKLVELGIQFAVDVKTDNNCNLHPTELLSIYCSDCKEVTCNSCFGQNHKGHLKEDVEKAAEEIRKTIADDLKNLSIPKILMKPGKKNLRAENDGKFEVMKAEVITARDEVLDLGEKHSESLLLKLDWLKATEIDFAQHMISYRKYCQALLDRGSAFDVCWIFRDLQKRTDDLKKFQNTLNQREVNSTEVFFRKTYSNDINIIGHVNDDDHYYTVLDPLVTANPDKDQPITADPETDNPPKRPDRKSIRRDDGVPVPARPPARRNEEIDPFLPADSIGLGEKERLILKNNQSFLIENIEPEKLLGLLSSRKLVPNENQFPVKKQETRVDKNYELLQWMKSMTPIQYKIVLQCLRSSEQFDVAKVLENGGVVVKSKIYNKRQTIIKEKDVQELNKLLASVYGETGTLKRKSLKSKSDRTIEGVYELKDQDIHLIPRCIREYSGIIFWFWCRTPTSLDRLRELYTLDNLLDRINKLLKTQFSIEPLLVSIYDEEFSKTCPKIPELSEFLPKPRDSAGGQVDREYIWAVAFLEKEMFVASLGVARVNVKVYDSTTFELRRTWPPITDFEDPYDFRSCPSNKCLYFISDTRYMSSEIFKVDPAGKRIHKWESEDEAGYLTVSVEGNVIHTSRSKNKLVEYNSKGNLIRTIDLAPGVVHPTHAIKLPTDQFVVSYGSEKSDNGVSIVAVGPDNKVRVIQAFSGKREREASSAAELKLKSPASLELDAEGSIFVADCDNRRVLLLSSSLEFKRIVASVKDGLRRPLRIYLDKSNGQTFVVDREEDASNVRPRLLMLYKQT